MDVNHFGPFSPEVWGTVSDWAMVVVTTITIYFLYKTFRSQSEVQRMQLRVTTIENERFRLEALPVFEIEVLDNEYLVTEDPLKLSFHVGFSVKNRDCRNLKLKVESHTIKDLTWEQLAGKTDHVMAGGTNLLEIVIALNDETQLNRSYGIPLSLVFNYEDMVGNPYQQSFHCILKRSGNHEVYRFSPAPLISPQEG